MILRISGGTKRVSSQAIDLELLKALVEIVKSVARAEVMPRYLGVARHRKSDGSLFTQADLAAQSALLRELHHLRPAPALAEEMSSNDQEALWASAPHEMWCIDPIDGTSNFVNGIPYFALSVALLRDGKPILGVVYDPVADEAFYAGLGLGAYLDDEALPISDGAPSLRESIAEVDFKRLPKSLSLRLSQRPPYASQRNFGASALEWCYVAAGRFDVYIHGGQKLWDYAAGALILEESGGHYCGLHEDAFWDKGDPWVRSVIAARRPEIFVEWTRWIREVLREPGP
jgi:myo-inositol-1(or 4)-monophosphatase